MKFIVLKPFFKLSEQKNYKVGDTADFTKEEAEAMLKEGYLEPTKEGKTKAKNEKVDLPKLEKND